MKISIWSFESIFLNSEVEFSTGPFSDFIFFLVITYLAIRYQYEDLYSSFFCLI